MKSSRVAGGNLAVAAALVLCACKAGGGGSVDGASATPSAGSTDSTPPVVANLPAAPARDDGGWTPDESADLVADATVEAVKGATGDRQAAIEAGMTAAIDQAMLVAPQIADDSRWLDQLRQELKSGVVPADVPGARHVVLPDYIRAHVRLVTVEWINRTR
jgi:hypothetical protein